MTYIELFRKAYKAFDPCHLRVIQGPPVEVLCRISSLADSQAWENEVDEDVLRQRLAVDYLDKHSVDTVLTLM